MTEIQCLCGAVHIELRADPKVQLFCHCDHCQAIHGAAYVASSIYLADEVVVTRGSPALWKLKSTPRARCNECGTRLFAEITQMGLRSVNAFLLPKDAFAPAFHMQCQFAVRPVNDQLPHFRGLPAAFGGSNERASW